MMVRSEKGERILRLLYFTFYMENFPLLQEWVHLDDR